MRLAVPHIPGCGLPVRGTLLSMLLASSMGMWVWDGEAAIAVSPAATGTPTASVPNPLALPENGDVTLNFDNASIDAVVKAVGVIAHKNFVLDPRVKGTINMVSSKPVPRSAVYSIFLSALRLQGFATIEQGTVTKIVPESDAKQGSTFLGSHKLSGDQLVTQIFPLQHESAVQMVNVLRPLVSPNNVISAMQGSNVLVVTDYADNIRRLSQIIASIDVPSGSVMQTIPLQFASAIDVAQTISRLMSQEVAVITPSLGGVGIPPIPMTLGLEGVRKTVVSVDVSSNALLIRGNNTAHLQQIRRLVAQLDNRSAGGGNVRVVYLKNAEAEQLATVLRAILNGTDVPSAQRSGFTSVTSGGTSSPGGGQPTRPAGAATSTAPLLPGVSVQADSTNNALIITAPESIYNNLRTVIDQLDARRAQIYVEVLIAEVTLGKAGQFGVQWLLGGANQTANAVGLSNLGDDRNSLASIAGAIASKNYGAIPGGFLLGVVNGSLDGSGGRPTLGALATALEATSNGNVLSAPNLLTLDNEEATILVGQNIPIITGTQASTGSNQNPFTTVQRQDIGIKLKVRPQVSDGGSIVMQISQEVSSIDTNVDTGGNGFVTRKRSIDSKVLVENGQTIVLGGLVENQVTLINNKVPLLGDIPILGSLFRYETRKNSRTNMMIFLRPMVLRDANSLTTLSSGRYQAMQLEQRKLGDEANTWHMMLPTMSNSVLPDVAAAAHPADAPTTAVDLRQYNKDKTAPPALPGAARSPPTSAAPPEALLSPAISSSTPPPPAPEPMPALVSPDLAVDGKRPVESAPPDEPTDTPHFTSPPVSETYSGSLASPAALPRAEAAPLSPIPPPQRAGTVPQANPFQSPPVASSSSQPETVRVRVRPQP